MTNELDIKEKEQILSLLFGIVEHITGDLYIGNKYSSIINADTGEVVYTENFYSKVIWGYSHRVYDGYLIMIDSVYRNVILNPSGKEILSHKLVYKLDDIDCYTTEDDKYILMIISIYNDNISAVILIDRATEDVEQLVVDATVVKHDNEIDITSRHLNGKYKVKER